MTYVATRTQPPGFLADQSRAARIALHSFFVFIARHASAVSRRSGLSSAFGVCPNWQLSLLREQIGHGLYHLRRRRRIRRLKIAVHLEQPGV